MSSAQNTLWIFGDQHRGQALGFTGDPNARTPRLDAMASQGLHFPNAVAGNPWCCPFRACLLTSLYSHQNGVIKTPQRLDPDLPLVTDVFNEHGYRTGYFGKWHLGGSNEADFIPREERGRFGTWIGYENYNAPFDSWVHGHDEKGRDDQVAQAEKLRGYETDALTDHLLGFLEETDERPFFAVLSVQPPHNPHIAPEETMRNYSAEEIELRPNVPPVDRVRKAAREELAGYYAQIENLDNNVGRVLDYLEKSGRRENTHVIFFSDHGDMHGSHGYLRKSSPWEESVGIPFIVQSPSINDTAGEKRQAPMNHVDIAPTSLGLCGLDIPEWMVGTDFSYEIDPKRPRPAQEQSSAFLQHVHRKRFDCLNRVWRGIRTVDGWKYVCLEGQPFGLFNLNEDPYELNNLAFQDRFDSEREALQGGLQKWLEKTGDSFSLPDL